MKIRFLKESALDFLKENIKSNVSHYQDKDNKWIYEMFDDEEPFLDFKNEVNDFELDMSEKDPQKTDLENIKRIYLNLKFLSESQAVDERLWAGLAHDKFWNYMKYRWGTEDGKGEVWDKKQQRYFYKYGKRRSTVFNGIARLWWIGRLTYDESLDNPFEITQYMINDLSTKSLYLISSKFTCNDTVRIGMFKAILEFERNGQRILRKRFNKLIKKLNLIGGAYLLDFFTEDEIKEKCIEYLKEIIKEEEKIKEINLLMIKEAKDKEKKKHKIIIELENSKKVMNGKRVEVIEYIINNLENINEFSDSRKLGFKLGVSARLVDTVLIQAKMGPYSKFLGTVKKII